MSKPLHNHKSDADFVLDIAKRLRNVPVSYGLDQFDIDCLADLSSRLRKAEQPAPPASAMGKPEPVATTTQMYLDRVARGELSTMAPLGTYVNEIPLYLNSAPVVLDKPARVGATVFRKGVAVDAVILAAQRAYVHAEASEKLREVVARNPEDFAEPYDQPATMDDILRDQAKVNVLRPARYEARGNVVRKLPVKVPSESGTIFEVGFPVCTASEYVDAATIAGLLDQSERVLAAVSGIADDYMTSDNHHPGYVLIPTAKFEQIRDAAAETVDAG